MSQAPAATHSTTFDARQLRQDFPILATQVYGKPLTYLDNAASSQLPSQVIEAVTHYERNLHANVHRGVHYLSQQATNAYEGARDRVQTFINAASREEIIFTRGTTEAINLVAASLGQSLGPDDEIVITWLEHHSNIVPWQLVCERSGAQLRVAPLLDDGSVDLEAFQGLLCERTRIVAISHISNALGTINPIATMLSLARDVGATTLVDGAQAVPHQRIDVSAINCDFYAFSGHKMFAPTGIGVLYGKAELLEQMPPYQGGGEMIRSVSFTETSYNALPYKFEAGTPNISGAIGLGASIDYLNNLDYELLAAHEADLLHYAETQLLELPGARIIGTAAHKASVMSFILGDIHAHDLGTIVDQEGVAIRTGHHCAMPVMERFAVPATARASFAFYNLREDVDRLIGGLKRALEIFT
jgi:cysteine desulfurase/selenocysteine lyase